MNALAARPPRVSIVSPIIARCDAISLTAIETREALVRTLGAQVRCFTCRCDFPELQASLVQSSIDLLMDPFYQASDVVIFEFGVYSPLFDMLLLKLGSQRHIVRFHNITPPELVPRVERANLSKGWEQVHLLREADLVWACSAVNAEVAEAHGVPRERIVLSPLGVDVPPLGSLSAKPGDRIEVLFLGRIVASKGVVDLVEAVARIAPRLPTKVSFHIAGNTEWSPPEYLEAVRTAIRDGGLETRVEFMGTISDDERRRLYERAHCFVLPSYHEGFCKPVVEALRAGCLPVTYDAYNLAYIAGGLGRRVPTGDVGRLSETLLDVIEGLTVGEARTDNGIHSLAVHDTEVHRYVELFAPDRFRHTVAEGVSVVMARTPPAAPA